MQKNIQFVYPLLLFAFVACKFVDKKEGHKSEKVEHLILSPTKTLDRIDTIPLGQINSIVEQENCIMIGEYQKYRVLVMNTSFKLKHILGKEGSGSGEFKSVRHHIIKGNKIYANDLGNMRLNIFNNLDGNFIKSIKLPYITSLPTAQFHLDKSNSIYYATDPESNGKMLVKLDSNGKLIKKFGENFQKTNNMTEDVNVSCREMIVHKNRIIVVSQTFGIVEVYDLEGNKINSFDISKYEPIKTNSELAKKEIKKEPNATLNLHLFCYVRNDRLYISPADLTDKVSNKKDLMVFRWSDTSCELIKTINFKTNKEDDRTLYMPIFVSEDEKTIYAQGLMTKNLYVFKMP